MRQTFVMSYCVQPQSPTSSFRSLETSIVRRTLCSYGIMEHVLRVAFDFMPENSMQRYSFAVLN